MSNLARVMDGHPTPGEICADYRPSVALYRLRNAPPADEYDADAVSCSECGSQTIRSEWREISCQTLSEPAENDVFATCECGNSWAVDDLRDLSPSQRPQP